MRRANINAILKMTKKYLDGEMSRIDYELALPYEAEKRYQMMYKEDADYADLIYYYLIECGTDQASGMSDEAFYKVIQRQYMEVLDGVY